MPLRLPAAFLRAPIAHRALHDGADGRPENSLSAIAAAVEAGFGIEIDLQLSFDGEAMVFHDDTLERMTGQPGRTDAQPAAALAALALQGGRGEGIPTLAQTLAVIAGKVALLIELKDQSGRLGPGDGRLEAATARALQGYEGPVAVMSFNPEVVARMAELAPDVPRGLTSYAFPREDFPQAADNPALEAHRARLAAITDYDRAGASFVSHHWRDLDNPRLGELRAQGAPILCWTIRSAEEERQARRVADNITFEGYLPATG
ncbi:MAG: phosphodiesterase [Pararhodobacter sp.]|nr:phosphodiesterase [Pararhodobacter sp.]